MRRLLLPARSAVAALTAVFGLALLPAAAGENIPPQIQDLLNPGGSSPGGTASQPEVSVTLTPRDAGPGDEVSLAVTVVLPAGSYTYPLKPSFGSATKIEIKQSAGLTPLDDGFQADRPPTVVEDPVLDEKIEKYVGTVTWTRKYRILPDAKPDEVSVSGTLRYQVCDTACRILTEPFDVSLTRTPPLTKGGRGRVESSPASDRAPASPDEGGDSPIVLAASQNQKPASPGKTTRGEQTASRHPFVSETTPTRKLGTKEKPDPLKLRFELSPKNAKPGDEVTASITADIDEEWHAFALTHEKGGTGLPVVIRVNKVNSLEPVGDGWVPDDAPKLEKDLEGKTLKAHYGKITWSRKFRVATSADQGAYGISGLLSYQICREGSCLPPKRIEFALGDLTTQSPAPEGSDTIGPEPAVSEFSVPDVYESAKRDASASLAWTFLIAFLGGFLLNFMPCVLPVIAIKVKSFVQQSGESPRRIFALNVAYALGVMTVFVVLATLIAGIFSERLGWGELFQKEGFNLVMALIVFAMALWLLGVYELQVPSFVGRAAASQQQEGLSGAFLTGIFATLLATPCSGPFLGTALAVAAGQPTPITYAIFGMMGLGMSFPYLVFAISPRAVDWLPKPGDWMLRFKEGCGFVLLGTVVFFMFILQRQQMDPIAVLTIMLGIALGLWMIGTLYHLNSSLRRKLTVRVTAAALTAGVTLTGAFHGGFIERPWEDTRLPWQPFSEQRLKGLLGENRTVLVDFTADWCLTCKYNEATALNTRETRDLISKHDVVPLYADYTNESEEIKSWLARFDSISVPLTVIFPAGRADQPIILRDVYTKATLLEKLQEAVLEPAASGEAAKQADTGGKSSQASL